MTRGRTENDAVERLVVPVLGEARVWRDGCWSVAIDGQPEVINKAFTRSLARQEAMRALTQRLRTVVTHEIVLSAKKANIDRTYFIKLINGIVCFEIPSLAPIPAASVFETQQYEWRRIPPKRAYNDEIRLVAWIARLLTLTHNTHDSILPFGIDPNADTPLNQMRVGAMLPTGPYTSIRWFFLPENHNAWNRVALRTTPDLETLCTTAALTY